MAKISLRTWPLILCGLVLFACPAWAWGGAQDELAALVVGVPAHFPPSYVLDPVTGKTTGLAVEMMDEVASRAGLTIRYQVFDSWPELFQACQAGQVDIIPDVGITEQRSAFLDFTVPHEAAHLIIFVRSSTTDITTLDDLDGRKVGVVVANQGLPFMHNRPRIETVIFESVEKAMLGLLSGNVAALVYTEEPLLHLAREVGLEHRLKAVGAPLDEILRAMAVSKGHPELLAKLDKTLATFISTPEFKKIYSKWHGPHQSFWTVTRAVTAMAALLVACIALLLLWRFFSLRRLVNELRGTVHQRQQADSTIQTLVESMVGVTGQECLDHITAGLCSWLKADCCVLGEFIDDQTIKPLSMQLDGEKITAMSYSIKGSPCASVGQDGYCLCPEKVCERFPDNQPLADLRAEGYVGTQIRDREGRVIGVLNAVSRHPLTLPDRIMDAMNILAARAAAEIDRHRTEQALEQELALNRGMAELSSELLATTHDISALARLILDKSLALTGSAHGYVSSIAPQTGDNIVHTFTDIMEGCRLHLAEKRVVFPRGADGFYPGLWGHALNTRAAFYTNAPATHAATTGMPAGHLAIERFLSVPVLFGQELIGQIALANPPRDFTDHDLKIIARVADLYALTLLNQRADEAQEKLTAELRHAQKLEAIGTLAGGIAHDFNNILSAIMGYTELAKDELPAPSQAGKDLDEVMQAARRARDLVKQLLTFSRQTDQEMRPLQLVLLLKEACKLLRASVPSSIDIKQQLDPQCGQVLADPTQVHQLLMNLATNSVQAMGEKGVLTISLQEVTLEAGVEANRLNLRPGAFVRLSVADTGPGMDQATMERIFEPFFTTRTVGRGSGMGLPVALGIVQKHKGGIGVESKPGQGTTFHVYFPRFEEETAVGDTPEDDILPTGSERILFVDDEATLTNMGKQLLERQGYQVTTETDSRKALELIRADPTAFDLVVTDQTMPGLTGLELAGAIVTIRPDLPIILCSGYSSVKPEPLQANGAVREFILKPLERGAIARTVRRVLDNR